MKRGYARPHVQSTLGAAGERGRGRGGPLLGGAREDVLPLANERFRGPELIFSPSDIGIQEAGLPEAVGQALAALPEGLRPAMCSNILVVGGNALIPGLVERLGEEVRSLMPREYPVRVVRAPDPIVSTWMGGARLATDRELLRSKVVTRKEYDEMGAGYLQRRFSNRN